ncbi:GNAT family N-acetyltransferase [Nesterenkonia sp. MY13]|uniref:GNAT family N-acetyltransferase n=1 Tax=Nesterenkonia sedimenti TaxID=1463632 RepID=A0A7X8TLH6_9MICC|nr:GNAT family N-acetyltransferase [Nesterenkonia sedimenti]NLS10771.1 GNAT family N-acetyltransferase [Nesterenkonia sedimenti]
MALTVRAATAADWTAIWQIIQEVAAAGETFAMEVSPSEDQMRREWLTPSAGRVVVATDESGEVLGTANMYPNRPNQGAHIASGSFMVADDARGRGAGRAMVRDMVDWATSSGYRGIQFNAVVATNASAVELYRSEGFRAIGTAPQAFLHLTSGAVDLLLMWRDLP